MTPIFSKLTGFALLVASISALSASDAGHLEEGAQGWVGSQRSTWSLVKNARAGPFSGYVMSYRNGARIYING